MIAVLLLTLLPRPAPSIGDTLEPFELRTITAQPFAWKPGRVTVLSLCAFWCDTWKDQLPRVAQAQSATEGLPVDYLTVSVDGRWTDRAKKVSVGTMLADSGGRWSHGLGIDRIPYTLVTDAQGTIVWATSGTIRTDDVTHAVRAALVPKAGGGTVYLTFDDFPSEHLSDELLDELRKEGVTATFFCIGQHVSAMPDVTKRAVREGHRLQVHSWGHDARHPDIAKCADLLATYGPRPDLYRAPGSEQVSDLTGKPLKLSVVDPYDYSRPGASEIQRRVLLPAHEGSMIQLHAGVAETLEALPAIIANLRKRGFHFETLSAP